VSPQDDERGPGGFRGGSVERPRDGVEIVAVSHMLHLPAVSFETEPDIFAEGETGGSVDRDVIVVVDQLEIAQPQVTRKRCSLAGDAFHHVAIADHGPNTVLHQFEARPVEMIGQEPLGDCHPHRIPDALAQRTGRSLDADGVSPLRMAWSF